MTLFPAFLVLLRKQLKSKPTTSRRSSNIFFRKSPISEEPYVLDYMTIIHGQMCIFFSVDCCSWMGIVFLQDVVNFFFNVEICLHGQ